MTTENEVVTETVTEPVIDMAAAEREKKDAELQELGEIDMVAHEAMLAEMELRIEAEKKIAAEQDAAMQVVKSECDAYRAALKTEEQQ